MNILFCKLWTKIYWNCTTFRGKSCFIVTYEPSKNKIPKLVKKTAEILKLFQNRRNTTWLTFTFCTISINIRSKIYKKSNFTNIFTILPIIYSKILKIPIFGCKNSNFAQYCSGSLYGAKFEFWKNWRFLPFFLTSGSSFSRSLHFWAEIFGIIIRYMKTYL